MAIGVCDLPLSAAKLAQPAPLASPQIQTQADQPPPSELPKLVEQLSAQPSLSAADCAKLARETITHGQAVRQSGQPLKPGIVHDGLAAVDRGEATDAKAADWPALRSQLQELLKPPPPKEDEKKQDEKKEEQKKDQQQQEQKKDEQKSQDQKQEEKQQQEQKSEEQKKQEQQQQQAQQSQQPPPEQTKDTQSVGGEKPKDDERKEHPELAVPLQKLDQVRDKDSPAELFQLLHDEEPKPADQPKKDW